MCWLGIDPSNEGFGQPGNDPEDCRSVHLFNLWILEFVI